MAEVKWIKLQVGMFDGMSFKKIRKAKIGGESFRDKLTAVWFELMDFAGQCNHDGAFISPHEIPFHDLSEIAVMIDREEEELNLCMSFFIKEGMITVVDDIYMLTNWERYQNTDGLEKIREQNRLAQQRSRARKKLLEGAKDDVNDVSRDSHVTVTMCHAIDKEKESDTDIRVLSNDSTYSAPAPKKKEKHKHGEFQHVLLSDDECNKLADKVGVNVRDKAITFLDEYIEEKGYKSKSHYLAIRRWVINAITEGKKGNSPRQASGNPFYEMLMEERNNE